MSAKKASPDFPIHPPIAEGWSSYSVDNRLVPADLLGPVFEAARWAPSSYNEQAPCRCMALREFVFSRHWGHPADMAQ